MHPSLSRCEAAKMRSVVATGNKRSGSPSCWVPTLHMSQCSTKTPRPRPSPSPSPAISREAVGLMQTQRCPDAFRRPRFRRRLHWQGRNGGAEEPFPSRQPTRDTSATNSDNVAIVEREPDARIDCLPPAMPTRHPYHPGEHILRDRQTTTRSPSSRSGLLPRPPQQTPQSRIAHQVAMAATGSQSFLLGRWMRLAGRAGQSEATGEGGVATTSGRSQTGDGTGRPASNTRTRHVSRQLRKAFRH